MATPILKPRFVHLRVHSDFSIKSGLMKIPEVLNMASLNKMPAVCVSDLNMFCGLIKLYEKAIDKSIKPICALDVLLKDQHGVLSELTLYARNDAGYLNIRRILTKAYIRAHGKLSETEQIAMSADMVANSADKDHKVVVTITDLETYAEGVICLIPSYNGLLGQYARIEKLTQVNEVYTKLQQIYQQYLFQGIARCFRPGEEELEGYVLKQAVDFNLPLVATNDVLFAKRHDYEIHNLRVCIGESLTLKEYKPSYTDEQYFKSTFEMQELFADLPQALANTVRLSQLCTVKIKLGHHDLPRFQLDPSNPQDQELIAQFHEYQKDHPDKDEEEWILETMSLRGLDERLALLYPNEEQRQAEYPRYLERLNYELDIIKDMKFPGYYLIVQEFINWSKNHNIPVGPGRGSGAGSLVAYCLKITDLDPLRYALLFERFLNPARKSMPDFDVDFCNEGRADVIRHIQDHYGKESVSQIMTFGTMGAKGVVRDVARVLGLDRKKGDAIANAIQDKPEEVIKNPDGTVEVITHKGNLNDNLKYNHQFAALYHNEDPEYKQIIDYAFQLEGLVRQVGKHAAGIVISPTEINDYSSLYLSEDGEQSTHFDKDDIERAGLVKFDFLGLKNLTIIKNAIRMINQKLQREGKEPIDIERIPLDDEASYKLLQHGDTHGIFQLESLGITKLVVKAQPKDLEDIIAIIALYRPGPLQSGMVQNYIDRKNGTEEVYYPQKELNEECLKEVLEPTYGVIVYQEQVMQIAQVFSGYSLGDADNLRRAMGKKKAEVMAAERKNFVDGAVKQGHEASIAENLFDLVDKFAGYGFNKSHSAAYGLISYQTAYLKAHYRAEFLAAVLTNAQSDIGKLYGTIRDLKNPYIDTNIEYLKPDINRSIASFYVNEHNDIVYSLAALKGVGEEAVNKLVASRQQFGPYTDLYDFIQRNIDNISETQIRILNYAGAFDEFIEANKDQGHSRETYDAVIRRIIDSCKISKQGNLFADFTADMSNYITDEVRATTKPWTILQNLNNQYAAFNFYFDGHPILEYEPERRAIASVANIEQLYREFDEFKERALAKAEDGTGGRIAPQEVTLVAHLQYIKKDKNFRNDPVLSIELSDETGMYKGFYPITDAKILQIMLDKLETDTKVVAKIRFNTYKRQDTGEVAFSTKIMKIAALEDIMQQCNINMHCLVDVSNNSSLQEFIQLQGEINNYLIAEAEYTQPIQLLYLSYYTPIGVIKLSDNFRLRLKLTRELVNRFKYIYGIHNLRLEVDLSTADNVFNLQNFENFRYQRQ